MSQLWPHWYRSHCKDNRFESYHPPWVQQKTITATLVDLMTLGICFLLKSCQHIFYITQIQVWQNAQSGLFHQKCMKALLSLQFNNIVHWKAKGMAKFYLMLCSLSIVLCLQALICFLAIFLIYYKSIGCQICCNYSGAMMMDHRWHAAFVPPEGFNTWWGFRWRTSPGLA